MRRFLSILLFLLVLQSVTAQSRDFQDALDRLEHANNRLNELIDSYKEQQNDVVKTEDVTIRDQNGNGVSCRFEPFYNNGKVGTMTTDSNGKFAANFNYGQSWMDDVISFRISECNCRVTDVEHTWSFPLFDEHINRIKGVIRDEISGEIEDMAKEQAENAVERVFEKLGAGGLASGFLTGFGVGAELGAPIGDYITREINKIFESTYRIRLQEAEAGLLAPRGIHRVGARYKPPLIGGLVEYFRTDPMIKNTWNIRVRCRDGRVPALADIPWNDYEQFRPRLDLPEHRGSTEEEREEERREQEQREEREAREREEQEREEREAREREERERRQREERERRERELQEAAERIKEECKICDPLREKIEEMNNEINEQQDKLNDLERQVNDAEDGLKDAEDSVNDAERKLEEFQNPESWVESEGERYTSSDLQIDRMVARGQWARYQRGEISAQELERAWEDYGPEERERAKEQYEQHLKNQLKEAKEAQKQAKQDLQDAKQKKNTAERKLEDLKDELEELKKQLEECLKKCKLYADRIARRHINDYTELLDWGTPSAVSQLDDCERYERYLQKYRLTPEQYQAMGRLELEERGVSDNAQQAIEQYHQNCLRLQGVVEEPEETEEPYPAPQQPEPQISCEEYCNQKGMTTQRQDWSSYILNKLNSGGRCAASASLRSAASIRAGDCTCYPADPPQISISSQKLICRDTACGDVACGESTECSCGENCLVRVSCQWGGWRRVGENTYQPTAGATSS